ncbi:MAG TPA: ABC transporter permease subunit [Thermomicrobiales bacterium]|nr:ABC transporter permease subunit [Thermomicrobiales bacterium]
MTITTLTIRQFLRSKSLLVVAAISVFPVLFAILPHFLNDTFTIRDMREIMSDIIYLGLVAATLLPLATLVLSTSALGDEVEDKTLQYLALKPVSRFRIAFEKWLAVILITLPVIWIGIMATWVVLAWGRFDALQDMIWPLLASSAIGVLGFGSVFLALSLFIPRALLFGVFYVFIWESTLSRFLPGIRNISISHYTRSLFVRLLDDRRVTIDGPSATTTIVITVACIIVVSLLLATWRLRTMAME